MIDCVDCEGANPGDVFLCVGDFGQGAFLTVLCETCWHRRQYRAELHRRKREPEVVEAVVVDVMLIEE